MVDVLADEGDEILEFSEETVQVLDEEFVELFEIVEAVPVMQWRKYLV